MDSLSEMRAESEMLGQAMGDNVGVFTIVVHGTGVSVAANAQRKRSLSRIDETFASMAGGGGFASRGFAAL